MIKKCVTIGLIFLLLVSWTGVAFSDLGFKARNIIPITILPNTAHPWEEDNSSFDQPSSSCPRIGLSTGIISIAPTITNLMFQLYVKHTVKSVWSEQHTTPER
jgi:hypothetical protein